MAEKLTGPVECEWRVFHAPNNMWEIIKEFKDEEGRKCTRFIGPMHREDAERLVKAVNMHERLVAFLKGHEQFETDVAAANDFNCEPASLPPPLYDDLLGMRCMRDELLKEAQGTKPDNLPGMNAEESALIREHKARNAKDDAERTRGDK